MNFNNELDRIAQQYRDEGYAVTVRPDSGHLDGLAGVAADLLATRGNETVVVRVKRIRSDVESDPSLPLQAAVVNARPGWRFDLIVLGTEPPLQRLARTATEPTDEQLRGMLDRARSANAAGFREMALTFAWAGLEAAMRRVHEDAELYGRAKPIELLSTQYANGFLSRAEFDRAREAWTIRNQVVHGFVTSEIDPNLITDLLRLAEKVKDSEQMLASSAAG